MTLEEAKEIYVGFDVNLEDIWNMVEFETTNNDSTFSVYADEERFGGEGQGENYYRISKIINNITKEETFIKFQGKYTSWDGPEFEYYCIVNPTEVLVTQYIEDKIETRNYL